MENNHSLQQPGMDKRLRKLSASMKERACKLSITSIERGMYLNDPLSTWKKIVYPQPVEQCQRRAGSRHWERKDEANCLLHLSILIVQKKRIGRVQKSCSRKRRKGESRAWYPIRCKTCSCSATIFGYKKRSAPGSDSLNLILLM